MASVNEVRIHWSRINYRHSAGYQVADLAPSRVVMWIDFTPPESAALADIQTKPQCRKILGPAGTYNFYRLEGALSVEIGHSLPNNPFGLADPHEVVACTLAHVRAVLAQK